MELQLLIWNPKLSMPKLFEGWATLLTLFQSFSGPHNSHKCLDKFYLEAGILLYQN